jgi:hypothetical protein
MREFDDVIATREIHVLDDTASPVETVSIVIGRPRPAADATDDWCCPCQVRNHGSVCAQKAIGVDAVQAIDGAILVAGSMVAGTAEAKAGRVRWEGSGRLGFPLPKAMVRREEEPFLHAIEDVIAVRKRAILNKQGQPRRAFVGAWGSRIPRKDQNRGAMLPRSMRYATVTIGRPVEGPSGEWACPYQTRGLGVESLDWAIGIDPIQALQGVLLVIGSLPEATDHFIDKRLRLEDIEAMGFPVVRDPPVGYFDT